MCGFPVAEVLAADELLQLSLFGGGCALYEFGLEGIVWVFCWGTDEEVPDFDRELRRKGGDHLIEARFLRSDASGVELCFDLGEPNGRTKRSGRLARTVAV